MNKLYYSQKYNPSTKAWRVIVRTQEEQEQEETLNKFKKLLGI